VGRPYGFDSRDLPRSGDSPGFVERLCEMLSGRHERQYCIPILTLPLTGWGYTDFPFSSTSTLDKIIWAETLRAEEAWDT